MQRPLSLFSLSPPTLSFYDPSQTTLFPPKPCGACSVVLTISDISTYAPQVQQMDGDPARPIKLQLEEGATNVVTS